jgi:NADP-dependent 3-hydroxy acid dehydrogenase YdfG
VILISGASSGIGEACAEVFAAERRPLFLVARRLELLEKLADRLSGKHGVPCKVAALDVASKSSLATFGRKYVKELAEVTVLVNNAGLGRGLDPIQEGKPEDWDAMIDTNLRGLLDLTRLVLPGMISKRNGHIVNMGSVAGRWMYPKGNVYCATKRAVSAITEGLRLDLAGLGIRVTEISPGMVETNFSRVRLGDETKAKAVYAGMTPLTARDIAESIAWCVNRPAHVNIQELVIYPTEQASTTIVSRRT